jgi:hypothetical protein
VLAIAAMAATLEQQCVKVKSWRGSRNKKRQMLIYIRSLTGQNCAQLPTYSYPV